MLKASLKLSSFMPYSIPYHCNNKKLVQLARTYQKTKHLFSATDILELDSSPPIKSLEDDMHLIAWKSEGLVDKEPLALVCFNMFPNLLRKAIAFRYSLTYTENVISPFKFLTLTNQSSELTKKTKHKAQAVMSETKQNQ